jgi:hypothetical protein
MAGNDKQVRVGLNTSTGLWERCAAKPGNEGRYGCPHARHDIMGKDEIAAANEKAIAAVNGNAGAALGKNRINAAAYMKSRSRLISMLRQQEQDAVNRLQQGDEPLTANEVGDDFVYISPGTSLWSLTDASFLYAKGDPVSNGIHDELLAVHDKDSFVRILHSKLPSTASIIAYRVLSDQGKTVDLSKADAEKLLHDADECGSMIAHKVFDDYKDKFTARELVDMARSMSNSRQYVAEVLRRDPDELLTGDGMSLNMARTCLALRESNGVKDIPGPVLDKAWEKLDYDVRSNYDYDTCSYAHIIEDKSLSDKTAAGIARAAAADVNECDLTADPDDNKDIERYEDGTMAAAGYTQLANHSSMRVATIEAYSQRKNHSDEVMRELFGHGCFMSGLEDVTGEEAWQSEYEMSMSEKDAKMLVYGVKHGYLADERVLDLARADDRKAHLFVESSANRSLTADVRKQLRAMIKKSNPFAGM